jgi:hypothetical protein
LNKYFYTNLYYNLNNYMINPEKNTKELFNNIPLDVYEKSINAGMVPFKNLKMGNIYTLANVFNNNGSYNLLGGNHYTEIKLIVKPFWHFMMVLYEYEIDDDVLVADIYKYKTIYGFYLFFGFLNYQSIYLMIHPNVKVEYLSYRYDHRINTDFKGKQTKQNIIIYKYKVSKA